MLTEADQHAQFEKERAEREWLARRYPLLDQDRRMDRASLYAAVLVADLLLIALEVSYDKTLFSGPLFACGWRGALVALLLGAVNLLPIIVATILLSCRSRSSSADWRVAGGPRRSPLHTGATSATTPQLDIVH